MVMVGRATTTCVTRWQCCEFCRQARGPPPSLRLMNCAPLGIGSGESRGGCITASSQAAEPRQSYQMGSR